MYVVSWVDPDRMRMAGRGVEKVCWTKLCCLHANSLCECVMHNYWDILFWIGGKFRYEQIESGCVVLRAVCYLFTMFCCWKKLYYLIQYDESRVTQRPGVSIAKLFICRARFRRVWLIAVLSCQLIFLSTWQWSRHSGIHLHPGLFHIHFARCGTCAVAVLWLWKWKKK